MATTTAAQQQSLEQHQPHCFIINLLCSRALVGRVIGKHGTTVRGIQFFTGALVDINQMAEPSTIKIVGSERAARLAKNIVLDIVSGNFKGFVMLREIVTNASQMAASHEEIAQKYVYAQGCGIFMRHKVRMNGVPCVFFLPSRTPGVFGTHKHNTHAHV